MLNKTFCSILSNDRKIWPWTKFQTKVRYLNFLENSDITGGPDKTGHFCSCFLSAFLVFQVLILYSIDREFFALQNCLLCFSNKLFNCRCKIEKNNTYSIVQLRFPIFCRYPSICVNLCSSSSMLKLKYIASIDREFCALHFYDIVKAPDAVTQEKKALN